MSRKMCPESPEKSVHIYSEQQRQTDTHTKKMLEDIVLFAKRRVMEALRRMAIDVISEEGLQQFASEEHIAKGLEAVDDVVEDLVRDAALMAFMDAMGAKRPKSMNLVHGYPEPIYYAMCLSIQN
jgi:hypothetical protein